MEIIIEKVNRKDTIKTIVFSAFRLGFLWGLVFWVINLSFMNFGHTFGELRVANIYLYYIYNLIIAFVGFLVLLIILAFISEESFIENITEEENLRNYTRLFIISFMTCVALLHWDKTLATVDIEITALLFTNLIILFVGIALNLTVKGKLIKIIFLVNGIGVIVINTVGFAFNIVKFYNNTLKYPILIYILSFIGLTLIGIKFIYGSLREYLKR